IVGAVSAFLDLAPPARRGEAMSLASLALYLGLGAGPALGEVTLARLGFPATWALAAAAGVAAAAIAARTPETRPPLPPERPRQRLVHPAGLLPGLVLLASILGMAGFLAFVPLHAPAVGMGGAGLPLAVFSGVVVAIRSLGARLPDRLGAARSTQLALLLSAVGSALIGAWPVRSGLLGGAVVLGVGVGLLTPAVFALAVEGAAAEERGVVIGTVSAFLDIALGVGPVSLGLVAAQLGLSATFLTSAAVAAVGLVAVVVLRVGRPAATG
ncbi:MAG TPA: MFS transporter, partial [Egibacteraceae bacterium]